MKAVCYIMVIRIREMILVQSEVKRQLRLFLAGSPILQGSKHWDQMTWPSAQAI
jgi:hypothetical protein